MKLVKLCENNSRYHVLILSKKEVKCPKETKSDMGT